MNIKKIIIKGFKSVDHLVFEDVSPFLVFAGANGAGKSNIADALAFIGAVVAKGASQAIREFGGFAHIHCFKRRKQQRTTISFSIEIFLDGQLYQYDLSITDANKSPKLLEKLKIDDQSVLERNETMSLKLAIGDSKQLQEFPAISTDMSALMLGLGNGSQLQQFLTNIRVFRIDPLSAKEPDNYLSDPGELDIHGRNVATILAALEKDEDFTEQVMEWVELIVPGMEAITAKKQKLDATTILTFKEEGTRASFPARLISDGTIYALCILTAVLTRANSTGITIIEEPERGIHPKAIGELVQLMRENANHSHPIFLTTHSESVVRNLDVKELCLVDKQQGKTKMQHAIDAGIDKNKIALDTAWLTNLFDGGLPW